MSDEHRAETSGVAQNSSRRGLLQAATGVAAAAAVGGLLSSVGPRTASAHETGAPAAIPSAVDLSLPFLVTIEAANQGKLKGESTRKGHEGKLPGLGFNYAVASPVDDASRQTTGVPRHQTVTFTHEWGASSPQLWQALITGESLRSVLFEFERPSAQGNPEIFYTIKLSEARVVTVHQYLRFESTGFAPSGDGRGLEDISLTFQGMELTNVQGKTAAKI